MSDPNPHDAEAERKDLRKALDNLDKFTKEPTTPDEVVRLSVRAAGASVLFAMTAMEQWARGQEAAARAAERRLEEANITAKTVARWTVIYAIITAAILVVTAVGVWRDAPAAPALPTVPHAP